MRRCSLSLFAGFFCTCLLTWCVRAQVSSNDSVMDDICAAHQGACVHGPWCGPHRKPSHSSGPRNRMVWKMAARKIIHTDMGAFYASVEQRAAAYAVYRGDPWQRRSKHI